MGEQRARQQALSLPANSAGCYTCPSEEQIRRMGNETRLVVEPLVHWLEGQKPRWTTRTPRYETWARGWDIEANCKNQVLLIEAKYIAGASISSFAGLVTAPMADRKYPSSPYGVCWAIGIKQPRNLYQILFDIMARNLKFWKHYGEDLRMKYIFFVEKRGVTRIPFADFLSIAERYADSTESESLQERRRIAKELLRKFLQNAPHILIWQK